MKKIIILLLLVPYFGFAHYHEGTIKFTNGNTLKGLIELPGIIGQIVPYKSSEEGKIEKYNINEID